ncbi:MAG: disulfide bond formation protein B [Pseudomonadota bacterium]|nr:disulfide bond formation protein B [Pseudomonadota bacterium]
MNLKVKQLNWIGSFFCALLMSYALFAQYVLGLEPCPLCIFQRISVITLGAIFLIAALYNPSRISSLIYSVLIFFVSGIGIGLAGRHIWLQNLPAEKVPACGPGLDFMLNSFPFSQVLKIVLSGSGECAIVDWSFLGLSMPSWVALSLSLLLVFGCWNNFRKID